MEALPGPQPRARTLHRRWVGAFVAAFLGIAGIMAATGCDDSAEESGDAADAPAATEQPGTPFNFNSAADAATAADNAKPRFEGDVNGVTFYRLTPTAPPVTYPDCPDAADGTGIPPEKAYGTELDFKYPSTLSVVTEGAGACNGVTISFGRNFEQSPEQPIRTIARIRADGVGINAPADRVVPIDVAGKAGVWIKPVVIEGTDIALNQEMVVIKETFGLTIIQGEAGSIAVAEQVK